VGLSVRVVKDELRRQNENESLTRRLEFEGRQTNASVTRLWAAMGGAMGYLVNFDYAVDSQIHHGSAPVALKHWKSIHVGAPLEIRYLASDPSRAFPAADPPNSQNHWLMVIAMVGWILLFMFGFAAVYASPILRQRRLLARGLAARGVVTRCNESSKGRRTGYFWYYDFFLPDGATCQGKRFSSSQAAVGTTITVLHDPKNPRRNAVYPMGAVRLKAS
jgi:Protein of unknown function (DUF3592)